MKRFLFRALILTACLLPSTALLFGAEPAIDRPFVHPLFSDHLVLQRGCAVPVWGWALCGSKVSVCFAGQCRSAVAGPDGKWMVRLKALKASAAPAVMTITGDQNQTVTISDVLVGEDKKFVWADARIDGKTVVVSSPQIPKPVAVRYAWDSNPECTLHNREGLPAVPFRTDDWPGITKGRH